MIYFWKLSNAFFFSSWFQGFLCSLQFIRYAKEKLSQKRWLIVFVIIRSTCEWPTLARTEFCILKGGSKNFIFATILILTKKFTYWILTSHIFTLLTYLNGFTFCMSLIPCLPVRQFILLLGDAFLSVSYFLFNLCVTTFDFLHTIEARTDSRCAI